MEWYYRQEHPEYTPLPPLRPGEKNNGEFVPMEFIYPENGSSILLPLKMDGSYAEVVFNLAHSDPDSEVFWHLDNSFIGSTKHIHQLTLRPSEGHHSMTAVDGSGNQISVGFVISLAGKQDGNARE
jgi:penicillin-binding protein 1C